MVNFVWVSWVYSLYDLFFPFLLHAPFPLLLWSVFSGKGELTSAVRLSWAPVSLTALCDWPMGGTGKRLWRRWGMGRNLRPQTLSTLNGFSGNRWVSSSPALAPAGQGCHGFGYFLLTLFPGALPVTLPPLLLSLCLQTRFAPTFPIICVNNSCI